MRTFVRHSVCLGYSLFHCILLSLVLLWHVYDILMQYVHVFLCTFSTLKINIWYHILFVGNWYFCRFWTSAVDCFSISAACCAVYPVLQMQTLSMFRRWHCNGNRSWMMFLSVCHLIQIFAKISFLWTLLCPHAESASGCILLLNTEYR